MPAGIRGCALPRRDSGRFYLRFFEHGAALKRDGCSKYSKSLDNITPKLLDMTVIHIKEDTKQLLMKFMAEIRQKEKKRVSYDETIKHLLVGAKAKNKKSLLPLFGCIGKEQAEQVYKDLEELKSLDEKRFEHLSRSRS